MTRWATVPLVLCAVATTPAIGQQDSLMLEAVRLATEGQGDSARSIVRGQMRTLSSGEAMFPEVLFTAGVIAQNTDSALAYFRRVSIEYGNSAWADRALLRMAQFAYAQGDAQNAARSAVRVLIDYPTSPVRAEASFIAARAYLDMRDVDEGCRLLRQARDDAGEDVEVRNRAAFYLQRCDSMAAGEAPRQPSTRPQQPSGPGFAVQVAAVSNAVAADQVMRQITDAGHEAVVVVEEGLYKVRVGRFANRAQAQELAAELRQRIGGRPFVVEIN
jgi:hypothetical protein